MTFAGVTEANKAPAGKCEGAERRDRVLGRLGRHRLYLTRLAMRTAAGWLLEGRTVTSDDLRRAMPKPPTGVRYQFLGAAFKSLQDAGICIVVGRRRSENPGCHGRSNPEWGLSDRAAAEAWLANHPPLEEPPGPGQLFPTDREAV